MRAFEDFKVGARETYGTITVELDRMLAFAREFDPQPMHLDATSEQAARIGGLLASGWYTAAANMRLMADHFILGSTGMGSPGVSSLKWLAPVRAGDTLTGEMTILGKRASATKPDRGFVDFRFELKDTAGRPVFEQQNLIMFGRRNPGARIADEGGSPIPRPPHEDFPAEPSGATDVPGYIGEVRIGDVFRFAAYDFTPENIIRFARDHDPQPFHLSEEAGRASHFGGLSASGWHTSAAWMASAIKAWHAAEAKGQDLPRRGPGLGIENLLWKKPVLADDRLTYYAKVLAARHSESRPGWGIITQRNYALNQCGEAVFAFTGHVLWQARP